MDFVLVASPHGDKGVAWVKPSGKRVSRATHDLKPSSLKPVSTGTSDFNRALNLIPKRAEQRQVEQLRETFSDSGVAAALIAVDHQVIYGRRGTGKTHALRYLESELRSGGDIAVYADLRTIGSPEGLFMGQQVSTVERAGRLLIDLLGEVHEQLLTAALTDDRLLTNRDFVACLDRLVESLTTVRVDGEVERTEAAGYEESASSSAQLVASLRTAPRIDAQTKEHDEVRRDARQSVTYRGLEHTALNFTNVARALRNLSDALGPSRIWLLLDEWGSLPQDVQPLLGEFLVRCILPLQKFTVKIAAIEQQTNFRGVLNGQEIGIELGADVAANVNLDEFMVYEQHENRSYDFFRSLFFKHLTSGVEPSDKVAGLSSERDLVRVGFTEKRAFEELVRSAEGVPRDAINIAAKAAMLAGAERISVNHIRAAARTWFQTDKEAALSGLPDSKRLLDWIIDNVIRGKRARGFLVNQRDSKSPLLAKLFSARVLHIVRRGYSAQDEPGERYDVWVIDYGAYVDLIHTKNEPQGLLWDDVEANDLELPDVPAQDLRAIRRAILDLGTFAAQSSSLE